MAVPDGTSDNKSAATEASHFDDGWDGEGVGSWNPDSDGDTLAQDARSGKKSYGEDFDNPNLSFADRQKLLAEAIQQSLKEGK
jgi:hypothetical protein